MAGHCRARMPVTFAAFDVLHLDGETVTRLPYLERRALLEGLDLTGPAWCTVLSVVGDTGAIDLGALLWWYLSGVTHSSTYALMQSVDAERVPGTALAPQRGAIFTDARSVLLMT